MEQSGAQSARLYRHDEKRRGDVWWRYVEQDGEDTCLLPRVGAQDL
jgi:hypothetical protein